MIGTLANVCAIIVGCLVGALLNRGIKDKYQLALYNGLGLASLGIGLNSFVSNMPKSDYPVLFILSIAVGAVIGTALDIDGKFKKLVDKKSKQGEGSHRLADGLSMSILLYCIGPLSMIGPVMSALRGDNTFLFTNATLDFVSSIVFASTYGIGIMLSAVVLFFWQGAFWGIAKISSTAISDGLIAELCIVGGLLIVSSGLSLLKIKECKTLNLLPSLLVPVVWYVIKSFF